MRNCVKCEKNDGERAPHAEESSPRESPLFEFANPKGLAVLRTPRQWDE